MTLTNANDYVGKPLGFGSVVYANEEKPFAPVMALFPVDATQSQPAALAA